jgi:hypothetical protein
MLPERLRSLEQLKEKSIVEVISFLPTFSWYVDDWGRQSDVKINGLAIVDYDTWKPRELVDFYEKISFEPGVPIDEGELVAKLAFKPKRTVGLTSLVFLDKDEYERDLYRNVADNPWVHIPMIDADLDLPDYTEEEAVQILKNEIKKNTEVEEGLILKSGGKKHFHFIGTRRLLNEDQLPTFIGLCLNMRAPGGEQLIDTKWAGHVLTPMKYRLETDSGSGIQWSAYDFSSRFATLRIGLSEEKPYKSLPRVVATL